MLTGPEVEAGVREALAPLLGERDASGEFVFPLPASARIDTLLLGCTHYPLLRPVIGDGRGGGDRHRRFGGGDGLRAGRAAVDQRRSRRRRAGRRHVQLTTGDVDAFRAIAERMFGEAFPDVAGVELAKAAA